MNPMVTLIQLNHGLGQFLRPRAVEYDSHPNRDRSASRVLKNAG
jgi:hypothetical protein